MRALCRVAVGLGFLCLLVAFACGLAAIWIVGPDSGRMAGTGYAVFCLGAALGFFGAVGLHTIREPLGADQ